MPETRGADRTKVLSVRLTADEFEALSTKATEVGVGPSTLARTFVRQGLAGTMATTAPAAATDDSTLEARLAADLAARIEALERWVAEH
jgi:hypothetical protein